MNVMYQIYTRSAMLYRKPEATRRVVGGHYSWRLFNSQRVVHRYQGRWRSPRTEEDAPGPRKQRPRKAVPPPGPFDERQTKQVVWLYMRTPEKLKDTEKEQLAFRTRAYLEGNAKEDKSMLLCRQSLPGRLQ